MSIEHWIWLSEVLGSCNPKFIRLLERYSYIEEIYERRVTNEMAAFFSPAELARSREVGIDRCREIARYCIDEGIQLIEYKNDRYPARLRTIGVPPALLYCTGDISALSGQTVSGIGARNCTEYGRRMVKHFFAPLVESQVILVSGFAVGIDSEVHKTAIEGGGKTVAVLGGEINMSLIGSRRVLRKEIEKNGAVVSEYPPDSGCRRYMFTARNRIISGLSRAVVIFEAGKKSGTLATANWAFDDGRKVFSVPGSLENPKSEGTNWLIKNGAEALLNPQEIFEFLDIEYDGQSKLRELRQNSEAALSELDKQISEIINGREVTFDEIVAKSGNPPGKLLSTLLVLEMNGIVESLPGQRYRLKQ